jgi:hypothetical protein
MIAVPLQAGEVDPNVERMAQSVEKVAETVTKGVADTQLASTELAFDKMEGYFTAAQGVIEKYGGDVATLGLNALRIDAASTLVVPFLCFVVGILAALIGYKGIPWAKRIDKRWETPIPVSMWALALGGPVVAIVSFLNLFKIWAWAGIFYPELWAIHKFILS